MKVFPDTWKDLWNQWDVRIFVLLSLLLQIILIICASWRKLKASKSFALFMWSAYLLADWVATFALGLLCNSQGKPDCDNKGQMPGNSSIKTASVTGSKHNFVSEYDDKLLAFWAPFLLLHLGGPDTITAFAMEDNELWPRHLLGLLFEVGAAGYVFLLSIPTNPLLFPTLLMFLAGLIKYFERTYALYKASLDGFRGSMLKKPDPGPNYAKLMEEYAYMNECGVPAKIEISEEPKETSQSSAETNQGAKKKSDSKIASISQDVQNSKEVKDTSQPSAESEQGAKKNSDPGNRLILQDVQNLQEAYKFFNNFKGLIVELIFSFHERNESRTAFLKKRAQDAFRVVEFELSFVYEVLFTKAVVMHHRFGYILRAICSCSVIAAFLSFFFLSKKHHFSKLDIAITYTLLGGAICLDAIAFFMLMFSDWTIIKLENCQLCKIIIDFMVKVPPKNRWSLSVTQHSLIDYCIPAYNSYCGRIMDRPTIFGKLDETLYIQKILRRIGIGTQLLDEIQYTWREDVTNEVKEHIYEKLTKKAEGINDLKETRRVCSCRGEWALEERGYLKELGYSVEVEFDESLLMWHIATDLCYYSDENTGKDDVIGQTDHKGAEMHISVKASMHRKFCKLLSDYLMYLLVMRPFMMSSLAVIGKIRYQDTCEETKNFFLRRPLGPLEEDASKNKWLLFNYKRKLEEKSQKMRRAASNLLSVKTEVKPAAVKGDRSKSVLFDACILAKKLKDIKGAKRWEIMSEVWIEMLTYAAVCCPGIAHAQRLSKGGELLTFVWFLMTHLGLGEQYRIEAGHARAKLIVEK